MSHTYTPFCVASLFPSSVSSSLPLLLLPPYILPPPLSLLVPLPQILALRSHTLALGTGTRLAVVSASQS